MSGTDGDGAFSPDYASARDRFRRAAEAAGARLEACPIGLLGPGGEDLTIDVARLGDEGAGRTLVASSGLHGVEGPFGSAVQVASLEGPLRSVVPGDRRSVVLIHALSPHGFAFVRRVDERNIDPNRNFLLDGQPYAGSPPRYQALDRLLNPRSASGQLDLFPVLARLAVARYGFRTLKQAVAGGQYDFPRGLFFGGSGPSRIMTILRDHLPRWVGEADQVVHLDFHTGLGPRGDCTLLVPTAMRGDVPRLERAFGTGVVEGAGPEGISYDVRGEFGQWCREAVFPGRRYDAICAEFGTYPAIRVLAALRAENRSHHWGPPDDPATLQAKRRLSEAFVPSDSLWRRAVVARGVELIRRALGVFS